MSYLQSALEVIKQDTTPEESLDTILVDSVNRIIERNKGMQYKTTEEIKKAEEEADRIYKAVLEGQVSLPEFQDACKRWERFFTDKS